MGGVVYYIGGGDYVGGAFGHHIRLTFTSPQPPPIYLGICYFILSSRGLRPSLTLPAQPGNKSHQVNHPRCGVGGGGGSDLALVMKDSLDKGGGVGWDIWGK